MLILGLVFEGFVAPDGFLAGSAADGVAEGTAFTVAICVTFAILTGFCSHTLQIHNSFHVVVDDIIIL